MSSDRAATNIGLVINVAVSPRPPFFSSERQAKAEESLTLWREYNVRAKLTGGLMVSEEHIVLILEGKRSSIDNYHRHAKDDGWYDSVQVVNESRCLKRRFATFPLAYVGPSRWLELALAERPLGEMLSRSPSDAEFLIDVMLSFVGGS